MKKVTKNTLTPLKQFQVAVLAVYLLGGSVRSIDTEDVAVKCHELMPNLFSWQKYRDQINLELVRVSLSDAKKQKNGGLLSGSGREGWRLSSRGLDWIRGREAEGELFPNDNQERRRTSAGSIDSVRRERERRRLMDTDAWLVWLQSKGVSKSGAHQVFRVDEYTTERMAAIKVARLRALFNKEDELSTFLRRLGETLLGEKDHG